MNKIKHCNHSQKDQCTIFTDDGLYIERIGCTKCNNWWFTSKALLNKREGL